MTANGTAATAHRGGASPRSQRTHAKVVAAATQCFVERGYLSTTMAEVAAAAEVTVQTLYLRFGSKVALLAATHDVTLVGDEEPVPVLNRPWVTQLRQEADGPAAVSLLVEQLQRMHTRVSDLYAAIQSSSADPHVAVLLDDLRRQQAQTLTALVGELATKSGYRTDLEPTCASDIVYALAGIDSHRLLVHDRSWSAQQWHVWVTDLLTDQLYPGT